MFYSVLDMIQPHNCIKKQGWNEISDIAIQPWGSKTCSVTTVDGNILTFLSKNVPPDISFLSGITYHK